MVLLFIIWKRQYTNVIILKLQQTEIVLLSFVRQSKTLPLSSCLIFPNNNWPTLKQNQSLYDIFLIIKRILWPYKIPFTILFLTGAPKKQILLPMTGKPMEQALISGFQNSKVKRMLKTWKPNEQASKSGFQNFKVNFFFWKLQNHLSRLQH